MKSEVPEYVSEALPDLIQSARDDDSTENKVVKQSFAVDFVILDVDDVKL